MLNSLQMLQTVKESWTARAFAPGKAQFWAYLLLHQAEVKRVLHHLLADDMQADKLSISGRGHE